MPPTPKRRRDYAAEYRRRQQRAEESGFENYYKRRTRDEPGGAKPEDLDVRRGHRGRADMLRYIKPGTTVICPITQVERDSKGRYVRIEKTLQRADMRPARLFVLRKLTRAQLVATIKEEVRRGAIFPPWPSLDQRQLVTVGERDGEPNAGDDE